MDKRTVHVKITLKMKIILFFLDGVNQTTDSAASKALTFNICVRRGDAELTTVDQYIVMEGEK